MMISESDANRLLSGLAIHAPAQRDAALVAACDIVPLMMGLAELEETTSDVLLLHGNASIAIYFGLTPAELEGKRISEIGVSSVMRRLWVAKMHDSLSTGQPLFFEYEYRPRSASTEKRWSKATLWPLSVLGNSGKPRFVYLIEDITPYRASEAALRNSRRFLEQVAQATPNIWYVYDLVDHRTVYANREIAVVMGYSAEEVQSMGAEILVTLIHADDLPETRERYAGHPHRRDGEIVETEFRARRKDGTYCWLACHEVPFLRDDETGLVRQILGVAQDITARHQAQEALARSESQLRLAMEGADIGTFVVDFQTGVVTLSPHARRHLGVSLDRETITILEMQELVYEDDRPAFEEASQKAFLERGLFDVEFRALTPEGALRWISTKAQLTFDITTQSPTGMIGVCFDIQERKLAEQQREAAAQRQERIAAALQGSLLSVAPVGETVAHAIALDGISDIENVTIGNYGDNAFPGWQVATLYEPALDEALIGGDFYDAFALSGNKTAFVVGDVAGKGLDAASFVAEVKFGLRSFLRGINDDPAAALEFLNLRQLESQVLDGRSREKLIALTIAVSDNSTGQVRVACAGSEPPILSQATGEARALTEASGLPLGAFSGEAYAVQTVSLGPGDTLLLYTDGLAEVRDPQTGQLLGTRGLLAMVRASIRQNDTSIELCHRLAQGVTAFATDQAHRDDVCLLAAMKR